MDDVTSVDGDVPPAVANEASVDTPPPVSGAIVESAPPVEANAVEAQTAPRKRQPQGPKVAPKWELDARERLKEGIRRYAKPLADMVKRDANEGDTRLLVTDFLCDGLGYDKYADLTTEYAVKGEFADYGVRIDQELVAFIEVKRATTKLHEKHLRQVEMYAVNEGVEWVILTNVAQWKVYHITGGLPMIVDLVFDVDLLSSESAQNKINQLFYISREALKRGQLDELWKAKRATSPKSLAQVLLSPIVLETIQRELKKQTDHRSTPEEIGHLLRTTILPPECFTKD